MELEKRVEAFAQLGRILRETFGDETRKISSPGSEPVKKLLEEADRAQQYNGWFTPDFVSRALYALGESLETEKLQQWLSVYDKKRLEPVNPKTVGVVMAGNVPAVGFHDFLSVLISGHRIQARLSSEDNKLMPAIAAVLKEIEPGFANYIAFTEEILKGFDAIIATGSNNTSRYFEYYFGKYPNIIRKNRNGVAVLTGQETDDQLRALADDVFLYYGLGCRNVAKLYVPENYDFEHLLRIFAEKKEITQNHKYFNNYEYNKAIFLVNKRPHLDTGNLLLVEDEKMVSPVAVLHYEYYSSDTGLRNHLMVNTDQIQCVVTDAAFLKNTVPFGKSQSPELWDYADGVDTLKFLIAL
ncbi:acyl-CoA reductase [Candidatus Sulfidibacterium hydrothermale]|uniref:acyl-CoA reductase n=1 Tax=Candidatus Sulfidibacterium hydrothermale TaxID=2875962 RepID=UPI001F0ADA37|nr:acyl-CoA reductase [Candidatus Sulfidibacterium hydrothermale]UBM61615.1 acyl-CoA reductase [Candidatus Sulfidibacterium hydrothermale]